MPPCQLADPAFEPGHGLVGNAPPEQGTVVLDREAEERPPLRPRNRTLFRIDLELETSFDEAGQAHHDPPAGLFAADVDVTVIRIPHKSVAATMT